MKKIFFVALGAVAALTASAREITFKSGDSELSYTVTDETSKTCEIGRNATCQGDIVIPEVVNDGHEDYSVTSIAKDAFLDNKDLKTLTIADNVQTIGENAFRNCTNLTTVTIGDAVISIGEGAFRECSSLENVSFGKSVESIGKEAFYECGKLSEVTLTDPLLTVGEYAFYKCTGLTTLTIPASVTSIDREAFYDCDALTQITYDDPTPINPSKDIFSDVTYGKAQLNIPIAGLENFETEDPWSNFQNINAIDFDTSIETVAASVDLDAPMKLFNLSGMEVSREQAEAICGVYLFEQNGHVGKLLIK